MGNTTCTAVLDKPSAVNKQEDPEYNALTSDDIPVAQLPDNAGSLKVFVSKSGELVFSRQDFSKRV